MIEQYPSAVLGLDRRCADTALPLVDRVLHSTNRVGRCSLLAEYVFRELNEDGIVALAMDAMGQPTALRAFLVILWRMQITVAVARNLTFTRQHESAGLREAEVVQTEIDRFARMLKGW